MKIRTRGIFYIPILLILLLLTQESNGQADTVTVGIDSTNIFFFNGSLDSLKTANLRTIDTSTTYFHQYDPLFKYNGIYSTLSNIGLAHRSLVFSPYKSVGFYMQHQSFLKYLNNNDQVRYYKQFIPYTELEYVIGSKKEQNFSVIFSRELWKNLTFGVSYALHNSPGPYKNNKANDHRVFFTVQYYTENLRYGIVANYLWNRMEVQENGGIKYDTVFEDNIESDRRIIPVNLEQATNTVKESGFYIEQYFNLLKPTADTVPRKVDAGNLSWAFQYSRNKMLYTDNAGVSSFYQPNKPAIDSANTHDSIYQERLRNKFMWSSIGYHENPQSQLFHIYFGVTHDIIFHKFASYQDVLVLNQELEYEFQQLTPFAGISLNISKIFRLDAHAEYVIGDYNSNDFKLTGRLNQLLGSESRNIGSLRLGVDFIARSPNWYFSNYFSNLYRWNYDFKKESYIIILAEYIFKDITAGARFYTFGNYTYFGENNTPEQLSATSTALQLYLHGTWMIKKWGINGKLVYQTTSQPEFIRLPGFSGHLNLFFKSPLFKRAATIQTGFQLYYFSDFYADSYNPAYRDFNIQNEKSIGNNIYADVYVSLQIKTARLFLKWAHFNSYFSGYNYYLAPHYPARDARIYFGINWRFHN